MKKKDEDLPTKEECESIISTLKDDNIITEAFNEGADYRNNLSYIIIRKRYYIFATKYSILCTELNSGRIKMRFQERIGIGDTGCFDYFSAKLEDIISNVSPEMQTKLLFNLNILKKIN